MKRIKVFKEGVWIAMNQCEDAEATQWIEDGKAGNWWGDPLNLTFEIEDITFEIAMNKVLDSRRAEYPTPEEFLNAFFDSGADGLNLLKERRIAVKAKYPKPERPKDEQT